MGKNAITYTFSGDNPYTADNDKRYNVLSRLSLNPVINDVIAGQIITAAGGARIADGETPEKCQNKAKNKWFDPRALEFSYATGEGAARKNYKTRVAFREAELVETVATTVRDIINGAGGRVNCISLIGEDFRNLVYELVEDFDALPDPVAIPRLAPFIFSGSFTYVSDFALDFAMPFRIASNAEDSVLGEPNCFLPTSGIARCRLKNSVKPRRMIITTAVEGTGEKQKSEIPIESNDAAQILACQTFYAEAPFTMCLRYKGEHMNNVERYL